MTRILAILLAAASALLAATVASHFREGNSIFLRLSDGSAQVGCRAVSLAGGQIAGIGGGRKTAERADANVELIAEL